MFYDEVDDAVNAAAYLRKQFYVNPDQLFVAGHSTAPLRPSIRKGILPIAGDCCAYRRIKLAGSSS
jgi:hypothetical protein